MTLHSVVLCRGGDSDRREHAPWGTWGFLSASDPVALATDPAVRAAETTRVLVLAPASLRHEAAVAANLLGSTHPEIATCVDVAPVPTGVLWNAVRAVADLDAGPAQVREEIRARVAASVGGAWMPGVTKLADPNPGMRLHLRSTFARGEGFLAVAGDPGWVEQLPLAGATHRISGLGQADAVSFGELPEPAIAALFSLGLASRPVRRDALGDAEARWGHAGAVEFTLAMPPASRPVFGACEVCGDPVWDEFCPFCHVASRRTPLDTTGVVL